MAGAGVLTIFVARSAMPETGGWQFIVLALVGLLTVGLMSVANFVLDSDFKWALLVPALAWLLALAAALRQRAIPAAGSAQ